MGVVSVVGVVVVVVVVVVDVLEPPSVVGISDWPATREAIVEAVGGPRSGMASECRPRGPGMRSGTGSTGRRGPNAHARWYGVNTRNGVPSALASASGSWTYRLGAWTNAIPSRASATPTAPSRRQNHRFHAPSDTVFEGTRYRLIASSRCPK